MDQREVRKRSAAGWKQYLIKQPEWEKAAERFVKGDTRVVVNAFNFSEATMLSSDQWYSISRQEASLEEIEEARSFVKWMLRGNIQDKGEEE